MFLMYHQDKYDQYIKVPIISSSTHLSAFGLYPTTRTQVHFVLVLLAVCAQEAVSSLCPVGSCWNLQLPSARIYLPNAEKVRVRVKVA